MRVLFTVQPSTGHLHPLVPVARALSSAGHDIAVASSASFRPDVEAFGLRHVDAGLDWLASDHATWTAFPPVPPPGPEFAAFVVTVFAEVTTRRMVPDLLRIGEEWKPDLIIRESMEYGGCLAAERLGIPHASLAGNGYSAVDSPGVRYFPGNRRLVADAMRGHRKELGLGADPDTLMTFRHLHLSFMPPSWDGSDAPRPPNIHFLRHESATRPGEALPGWVAGLPGRPVVLASLGTVFNATPGVLEMIVEALGGEPITVIVVLGPNRDARSFGQLPANVRLEPAVPQPLLLRRCDLLITHGGFNSVKEAAIEAVPMVVLPITADQPYNAQRCAALGIGRVLGPDDRRPAAIRDAARTVLADSSYREAASQLQHEMRALPGRDHLVSLVESLARNGAAVS
jgi:UDP:flavonoid glycosyltransferase YjiC (YdhE family)